MNKQRDSLGRILKGAQISPDTQFKKGYKPVFTKEHKEKISKALIGKIISEETRKKMKESRQGRKMSEEAKKHLSDFWRGKKKSRKHTENIRLAKLGDKNPLYKGAPPKPEREKDRFLREMKYWRKGVYGRDWYTCQKTGIAGKGNLVAHHINNYHSHEDLRFELWNGITMLRSAHLEFHRIYGLKNNNLYQLEKFLGRQLPVEQRAFLIGQETADLIKNGWIV